jgi:hypothetical protein
MAETTTDGLHVPIKTTFDGYGTTAANAAFDKTKGHVKETDSAAKDLGYTAEALKTQLMGLLAAGAVWQQFKEGFEQVTALEQTMNQLERAVKRNGDSFSEVRGKIVGMADALKKAAGVDDDAAIKKMAELYNATGDVANAMALVALSTDVAVGAGMDLERAMDLVTRAAMGQTRGLKELNISIEEGGDKTENANKALEAIRKNFGGAANDAKGLKVEVNRLSEAYEDLRNNIVEKVSPAFSWLIKVFLSASAYWSSLYDLITTNAPNLGAVVTGTMRGLWEGIKGNTASAEAEWAHVVAVSNTNASKVAMIGEELKKKLSEIWSGVGGSPVEGGKPKAIVTPGSEAGTSEVGKYYGPSVQEAAKLLEAYEEKVFKFEQEMIKERAKAWEKHEAAKLAMKKAGAKEETRIEKELDKQRADAMDAQTQRIKDQALLEKEVAKEKAQMGLRLASAAVGLGRSLFGESKELALAEAMINTAAAVTEASPNVWLMAFAAVSGAAQIAKIQSIQPSGNDVTAGKGFDNAQYDAAAVAGGRRWAMDMVGKFGSGASAGWADGMRGAGRGNTYDNRSTNNYNISVQGFLNPGDQHSMAQFARRLAVVNKTVEGQRRTARTSR